MKTFTLKMDLETAKHLQFICELVARIGIRQFREILQLFDIIDYDKGTYIDKALSKLIEEKYCNASIGNQITPTTSKIAWDLHQHIRREISWYGQNKNWRTDKRDWQSQFGVTYDDPLQVTEAKIETEIK